MKRRDALLVLLLVVFGVVVVTLCVRGQRACTAANGHYVRGLFWMECVR